MRRAAIGMFLTAVLLASCELTTVQQAPPVTPTVPAPIPATLEPPSGGGSVVQALPVTLQPPIPTSPGLSHQGQGLRPPTAAPFSRLSRVGGVDLGLPAGNSYGPRALAYLPGLDRIYVRTQSDGTKLRCLITAFDATTGSVVAVAPTEADTYRFGDLVPSGFDASGGDLLVDPVHNWVISFDDLHTAVILEAQTLQPIRTLQGVWGMAVDPEKGEWYVAYPGTIQVYDGGTMEVLRKADYGSGKLVFAGVNMELAAGRLFVVGMSPTEWVLQVYDAASLDLLDWTSLGSEPKAMLPEPNTGRLHIVSTLGQQDMLSTYDTDLNDVRNQLISGWPDHVISWALSPSGQEILLGRSGDGEGAGTAEQLLTSSTTPKEIKLPYPPDAMVVDEGRARLWVSHSAADRVSVIDLKTWQVLGTYPTAAALTDLAVDSTQGHFYVTDTLGRLMIYDGLSGELLAQVPGEGHIAVDATHGRFYAGSFDGKAVRVYDAASMKPTGTLYAPGIPVADAHSGDLYVVNRGFYAASSQTLAITGAIGDTVQDSVTTGIPTPVDGVVDPGTGRVFAIMAYQTSDLSPYPDEALWVYEPDPAHPGSYTKLAGLTLESPVYVDVDPATGWAYVSSPFMTGILVDGRIWRQHPRPDFGPVRVDPQLGHAYVTPQGGWQSELLVLDATTLEELGSTPILAGMSLRALDVQHHLLYLANDQGRIEIWTER